MAAQPALDFAQEPTALTDIKDPAEIERAKELVEGARKEGALSWIGVQFAPDRAKLIIQEFKRYYGLDSLEVQYSYTPSGEIIARVEKLFRDDSNSIDIVWTSSPSWYKDLLRRGEIMRYDSPYYKDYTFSHEKGMSEPGFWVSDAYTFLPLYNPRTFESRGLTGFRPNSWGDLIDPRLADTISMIDPMVSATAAPILAGIVKTMGDDWLTRLGANRPALHVRGADGREGVGIGKWAITMFGTPADTLSLLDRGIPVEQVFPKEGVVLVPFAPIILKRAPHPCAAQLFIDFVRSPYGTQGAMATKAGATLFFGRPGVSSKYPHLLPADGKVTAIPFNWDTEATDEAIDRIRKRVRAAGIGLS